ncbi:trichohyalin-like [Anguilla rostrata]|uniref:trichohyalin-like n=1 Tax=Anguilla rostrata TaxID=7938 RepID=UPI0030CAF672
MLTRLDEHMRLLGEMVWGYTLVLFTCGDRLAGSTIEQYIVSIGGGLQRLLGKCENRYHVLNNLNTGDETQVTELLKKVEHMRSKNCGCYVCEKRRHVEPDVQPEQELQLSQQWTEPDEREEQNWCNRDQGQEQIQSDRDQVQNTTNCRKAPRSKGTTEISPPPTLNRSRETLTETLQTMSTQISGEEMYRRTVVLFTYVDKQQSQGVEEHVQTGNKELQECVGVCYGGCHTLDNRYRGNGCQVAELLGKVQEMVAGSVANFYSSGESQAGRVMRRPIPADKQRGKGEPGEWQQEEGHISGPALEAAAQQAEWNVEQGRPLEKEIERRAEMRGVQAEREEPRGRLESAEKEERGVAEKEAHLIPPRMPNVCTSSTPARHTQALQQLGEMAVQLGEVTETLRLTCEEQAREEAERHRDAALQLNALRTQSAAAAQEHTAALTERDQERDKLQAEIERLRESTEEKDREMERLRESCVQKDAEIERLKEEVAEVRRRFEETSREVQKNKRVLQQLQTLVALVNAPAERE